MKIDVDACLTFLDFVAERHRVWERRQAGAPQPWTEDPVLATRKFTNVFRWLDPGSQFVLTDLLEPDQDPVEFLMRCFLYRHTGRVETWEYLSLTTGYPTLTNLAEIHEAWKEYRGKVTVKRVMGKSHAATPHKIERTSSSSERPMFTGAYLVFPQSSAPGTDKLESIVLLTQRLIDNGSFSEFVEAQSQEARFGCLRRNKGVADFMSMQTLTDFGYSTEFREDDFVVPGPGAIKGAAALGMKAPEAIEWAWETLHETPDQPRVAGRALSKMDVQNCLCEFSKYVRFASKPSPQKLYAPAHPGVQSSPVLPPKWH